ncbi:MAG: hypothetical protein JKY61_07180 [Planctomycetes bacterium]|nr:hypothetical protein [Planctomycetota bacterium]
MTANWTWSVVLPIAIAVAVSCIWLWNFYYLSSSIERPLHRMLEEIRMVEAGPRKSIGTEDFALRVAIPSELDGKFLVFASPYSIQFDSKGGHARFGEYSVAQMAKFVSSPPDHHIFCFGDDGDFIRVEDHFAFAGFVDIRLKSDHELLMVFEEGTLAAMRIVPPTETSSNFEALPSSSSFSQ